MPDISGEPQPLTSPLAGAVRHMRAEMGRDMGGTPLATDRFAVLDEEGVTEPWVREVVRLLWLAEDDETAAVAAEVREADRQQRRLRGVRGL